MCGLCMPLTASVNLDLILWVFGVFFFFLSTCQGITKSGLLKV